MCYPLRKGVTDDQGAMLIVNPLTAWAFLLIAKRGGHKAIVHTAAASSLGRWLIPLARERKVKLIHVVRKKTQEKLLRDLGEEHVFDSSEDGFDDALKGACKKLDATIAFDAVAGDTALRVLRALPRGSELCVYGALSEQPAMFHPGDFIFANKTIRGMWLSTFFTPRNLPQMLRGALVVQRHIANGQATAVQERVHLEDMPAAIDRYAQSMTDGKILWVPSKS